MKVFEACGCGASIESSDGATGLVPTGVVNMIETWRANHRHSEPVAPSPEEEGEIPNASAVVSSLIDFLAANNMLRTGVSRATIDDAIRVWAVNPSPVVE